MLKEWPADAPEWARYMAADRDGEEYFYAEEPYINAGDDYWTSQGRIKARSCIYTREDWKSTAIEAPKRIKWGDLRSNIVKACTLDANSILQYPTDWIAWNCDEDTRGNPLPNGLVIEVYTTGIIKWKGDSDVTHWNLVTRFRVVGKQEGWK